MVINEMYVTSLRGERKFWMEAHKSCKPQITRTLKHVKLFRGDFGLITVICLLFGVKFQSFGMLAQMTNKLPQGCVWIFGFGFKSIDLKSLDSKSIDFKISCLDSFIQRKI